MNKTTKITIYWIGVMLLTILGSAAFAAGVYFLTIGRSAGKTVTENKPIPIVMDISPTAAQNMPTVIPANTAAKTGTATTTTSSATAGTPTPALPSVTTTGNVVCIDPGHPSEVSSAETEQNGVTEVAMNWEVALRLKALLEAKGITVVMTKNSLMEKVTNKRRAEIANDAGAAILLRLHCDTGNNHGYTIYAPNRQGTAQGKTGPSQAIIDTSQKAAEVLHTGINTVLSGSVLRDNGVKGDSATSIGSKQGALTGSIFSTVPAVTVEMCFLSNADDAQFISSETGQNKMADALARGVVEYLNGR